MPYLSIGMVHVCDVDNSEQIAWKTQPEIGTHMPNLEVQGLV